MSSRPRKASPTSSPFSHLPLVGREADTRTLQALHQAVEQGRTQAVLLQGEAGVGKTRLASTFLRWVASQGTTVLQGRAFEMGGRLPYRPLVHALGRHLEEEPVLERAARWLDWTYALGYLGSALAARGHVAAGVAQGQRTVERARRAHEMKNGRGVMARHFLSIIHLFSGDYLQMLEENDQVVKEAQQLQDWLLVYWGYGFRSWAEGRLGRHEEAMESMTRAQTASQRLGGQIMGQDILEAVTAELLLADVPDESALYQVEEALARAEATIALSREEVGGILGEGLAQRVWGQALARLERWEEAERHLAESWQILLSGENLLEAARTQVA